MPNPKSVFLVAEWRKLVLANYEFDPKLLQQYLPYKTELDLWNDTCYVSLVGFMFMNTRVLGMPVPRHINFEEVNLRFYVRHKEGNEWKRGVVFIKELVPRLAITQVANYAYKEHYQTVPMKHTWKKDQRLYINYSWKLGGEWHQLAVTTEEVAQAFGEESEEAFITEHYWGYTKVKDDLTYEYAVEHPTWEAYPVRSHDIQIDTGKVYGEHFKELGQMEPKSVFLAEGSRVMVRDKSEIT